MRVWKILVCELATYFSRSLRIALVLLHNMLVVGHQRFLLLILICIGICTANLTQFVDVTTPLGTVRGVSEEGYWLFKSIPFALPPVGSLR